MQPKIYNINLHKQVFNGIVAGNTLLHLLDNYFGHHIQTEELCLLHPKIFVIRVRGYTEELEIVISDAGTLNITKDGKLEYIDIDKFSYNSPSIQINGIYLNNFCAYLEEKNKFFEDFKNFLLNNLSYILKITKK